MRRAIPALLLVAGCGARQPAPAALHVVEISCRDRRILVEVAADEPTRERGLMFRRTLDADAGMLFVFPRAEEASFWMKDTYLPLSIAFIAEGGRIVNVDDMEPFDSQTLHRSNGPVSFALEMNRGWFAEHGVGPGDSCDLRAAAVR